MYSTVLRHGVVNTLRLCGQLLKEADLHEEKVGLMRWMGAVSQPDLIKKVLEFSMSVGLNSHSFGFKILMPSMV